MIFLILLRAGSRTVALHITITASTIPTVEPIYDIEKNPLGWLDTMLNAVEHMNFFEGRATEYSKASTQGTWVEAFS